ncbi:ABC transporter ATP-binding protein [uncultured Mesonia sp.]|uniref:ABC transporter ATP-binding protein n=1 Tax=uncultured Mesonia sp. TaxID=399731 RepID=UPI00374FC1F6
MTKPILHTTNLSIGYHQECIAQVDDLNINKGELVAIIGKNGAGKSTLLKTLSGNLSPQSGKVSINNTPVCQLTALEIAKKIAIVLTKTDFSTHLSVQELVALGRQPYTNWLGSLTNRDKKKVIEALNLLDIAHKKRASCSNLSDGQLQKAMLARAIAQDTPLIILDEPTSHLDLYHKVFVLKTLRFLSKKTNKAIVFASHEIDLALQLCDKIILVHQAKVKQYETHQVIESNILNQMFPSELIYFDKNSKSFKIKDAIIK